MIKRHKCIIEKDDPIHNLLNNATQYP